MTLHTIALLFESVNLIKFAIYGILNSPIEMYCFLFLALTQRLIRERFIPR